jgi:hypothetical protein
MVYNSQDCDAILTTIVVILPARLIPPSSLEPPLSRLLSASNPPKQERVHPDVRFGGVLDTGHLVKPDVRVWMIHRPTYATPFHVADSASSAAD